VQDFDELRRHLIDSIQQIVIEKQLASGDLNRWRELGL